MSLYGNQAYCVTIIKNYVIVSLYGNQSYYFMRLKNIVSSSETLMLTIILLVFFVSEYY